MTKRYFDVFEFGATGDGKVSDTDAIQQAIDVCHEWGGGIVRLTKGCFKSGTIELKSGVFLEISEDAVLLASDKCEDYREFFLDGFINRNFPRGNGKCLIFSGNSRNAGIFGGGTIDGNGSSFVSRRTDEELKQDYPQWLYKRIGNQTPPRMLFFLNCGEFFLKKLNIINAPSGWSVFLSHCENVECENLKIVNDTEYENNDGIHLQGCKNVLIKDCNLKCGDDCIVVRANNNYAIEAKKTENIKVKNCKLQSSSSAIRIGWVKDGEICRCAFERIFIHDSLKGISIDIPGLFKKSVIFPGSDIGNEYNDIHDISFRNIRIERTVTAPISINLTDMPDSKILRLENILFSEIKATGLAFPDLKDKKNGVCRNVVFKDCTFIKEKMTERYPVYAKQVKQQKKFLIHTENLTFENTELVWGDAGRKIDLRIYAEKQMKTQKYNT